MTNTELSFLYVRMLLSPLPAWKCVKLLDPRGILWVLFLEVEIRQQPMLGKVLPWNPAQICVGQLVSNQVSCASFLEVRIKDTCDALHLICVPLHGRWNFLHLISKSGWQRSSTAYTSE
jgi:hypothetical protein